ncbi:3-oxoacyl-[acyl-carrier-protein] synthase III C-terminal domain-containing protein [Myceligenerans xiligouense]|uniref:3-oxoacyl-[acyl-carrier-protein] synthase-3 n=1 Tax=Myceligenerans xiligouense TaxID=253184 RepID=A0A3N4YFS6_9MICO|nr:3-oxoacyl-[acyl-carrier-protein] synthase III C-terminal domain-containing protein [Myceligenerans xiligouense]RPF19999.1 3-oxoacyl-[acyl-carrier-protein] synthase-3 [Myceligenerans xiligouense]
MRPTTAIRDIGVHLPAASEPVEDVLRRNGVPEREHGFYRDIFGFGRVRREPGRSLEDQLADAARPLLDAHVAASIRYVIHAPTVQFTAPYPEAVTARVATMLGLDRAVPFALSQHACASALLAVEAAGLLLDHCDPGDQALVLAGEKTFRGEGEVIEGSAVMGEGMAAVLVGREGDRMLTLATRTLGGFDAAPFLAVEAERAFTAAYVEALSGVIRDALEDAGLPAGDVDHVFPHNVNRISWLRVRRQVGLGDVIRLGGQGTRGHCFGADPFLAWHENRARMRPGDRYLLVAAGLGATLTAALFEHGGARRPDGTP